MVKTLTIVPNECWQFFFFFLLHFSMLALSLKCFKTSSVHPTLTFDAMRRGIYRYIFHGGSQHATPWHSKALAPDSDQITRQYFRCGLMQNVLLLENNSTLLQFDINNNLHEEYVNQLDWLLS